MHIELNPLICTFCKRQLSQECLEACNEEGMFRHLSPVELDSWRQPPSSPSMDTLLTQSPGARLAIITLILHYWIEQVRDSRAKD